MLWLGEAEKAKGRLLSITKPLELMSLNWICRKVSQHFWFGIGMTWTWMLVVIAITHFWMRWLGCVLNCHAEETESDQKQFVHFNDYWFEGYGAALKGIFKSEDGWYLLVTGCCYQNCPSWFALICFCFCYSISMQNLSMVGNLEFRKNKSCMLCFCQDSTLSDHF